MTGYDNKRIECQKWEKKGSGGGSTKYDRDKIRYKRDTKIGERRKELEQMVVVKIGGKEQKNKIMKKKKRKWEKKGKNIKQSKVENNGEREE